MNTKTDAPLTPPAYGSKRPSSIFTAVGGTLTSWEQCESEMASIFATLVGDNAPIQSASRRAAIKAYGTVQSHGTRVEMVRTAAKVVLGKPKLGAVLAMTLEAIGKCQELSAKRNNIAHGAAVRWSMSGKDRGFFLEPAPHNTKKQREHGKLAYRYTADDIKQIDREFMAFRKTLQAVHKEIRKVCVPSTSPE